MNWSPRPRWWVVPTTPPAKPWWLSWCSRARPEGEEAQAIAKQLRDWAKEIGPIAKPKDIRFGDNLPKTRSGKIMRRLLRVVAKGEEITQDVSTLENPAILDHWPSRCRSDAFRSARRPSASWTKRRRARRAARRRRP